MGIWVASVGPLLVGSIPKNACIVVLGPLEGIPITMGGKDVDHLLTILLWKGSRNTPAMGLDSEVNKLGLDW